MVHKKHPELSVCPHSELYTGENCKNTFRKSLYIADTSINLYFHELVYHFSSSYFTWEAVMYSHSKLV